MIDTLGDPRRVALYLSGDSHHYAHLIDEQHGIHYVTAGGGGVYPPHPHAAATQRSPLPCPGHRPRRSRWRNRVRPCSRSGAPRRSPTRRDRLCPDRCHRSLRAPHAATGSGVPHLSPIPAGVAAPPGLPVDQPWLSRRHWRDQRGVRHDRRVHRRRWARAARRPRRSGRSPDDQVLGQSAQLDSVAHRARRYHAVRPSRTSRPRQRLYRAGGRFCPWAGAAGGHRRRARLGLVGRRAAGQPGQRTGPGVAARRDDLRAVARRRHRHGGGRRRRRRPGLGLAARRLPGRLQPGLRHARQRGVLSPAAHVLQAFSAHPGGALGRPDRLPGRPGGHPAAAPLECALGGRGHRRPPGDLRQRSAPDRGTVHVRSTVLSSAHNHNHTRPCPGPDRDGSQRPSSASTAATS